MWLGCACALSFTPTMYVVCSWSLWGGKFGCLYQGVIIKATYVFRSSQESRRAKPEIVMISYQYLEHQHQQETAQVPPTNPGCRTSTAQIYNACPPAHVPTTSLSPPASRDNLPSRRHVSVVRRRRPVSGGLVPPEVAVKQRAQRETARWKSRSCECSHVMLCPCLISVRPCFKKKPASGYLCK